MKKNLDIETKYSGPANHPPNVVEMTEIDNTKYTMEILVKQSCYLLNIRVTQSLVVRPFRLVTGRSWVRFLLGTRKCSPRISILYLVFHFQNEVYGRKENR